MKNSDLTFGFFAPVAPRPPLRGAVHKKHNASLYFKMPSLGLKTLLFLCHENNDDENDDCLDWLAYERLHQGSAPIDFASASTISCN